MKELVVLKGEGERYPSPGGSVLMKAVGAETNGQVSAFVSANEPGKGPPLHIHHTSDELFWVVDGRWQFRVGEETFEVAQGAFVFIPRGTVHTFQNAGAAPADILILYTPAGPEGAFAAALRVPREDMTRERALALGMEYDTEIVGPPLEAVTR